MKDEQKFQASHPEKVIAAGSNDPLVAMLADAEKKSESAGMDKRTISEVALSPNALSFLCLYRSYAKLTHDNDGIRLLVAKPDDINEAADVYESKKDPSAIHYPTSKAEVLSLPIAVWEEVGVVLLFAGLFGHQFWSREMPAFAAGVQVHERTLFERAKKNLKKNLSRMGDGYQWKSEDVDIRIYPSSLATQEASWLYINESSLHLDVTGCYLLGLSILSLADGRNIDRVEVEEALADLIDTHYSVSENDDE